MTVPRQDYFLVLVEYGEQAYSQDMYQEAWESFHIRRGDFITVRSLHLRKLLKVHDVRQQAT